MGKVLREDLKDSSLHRHLQRDRYGNFQLTEAIRPSLPPEIIPREGYRLDFYEEKPAQRIPVVVAAVTREKLWEVFLDLLDALDGGEGEEDVVLKLSHDPTIGGHIDYYREAIDAVVLRSYLYDFEDLLMRDGYTGIAVLKPHVPVEVQFDEHKLLFTYARNVQPFVEVMEKNDIRRDDGLRIISEGAHFHLTEDQFPDEFERMRIEFDAEEED